MKRASCEAGSLRREGAGADGMPEAKRGATAGEPDQERPETEQMAKLRRYAGVSPKKLRGGDAFCPTAERQFASGRQVLGELEGVFILREDRTIMLTPDRADAEQNGSGL